MALRYLPTSRESFEMQLEPIAHIENGFESKFGVPRQSGLCACLGRVVFEDKYRVPEAVRGLEEFSHIWLIWGFSEGFANGEREFSPTVRPPRLGGNIRMGVFATRSPNRPNKIAISAVRLLKIDMTARGPELTVSGADLMNGTPIYDIKPYISYSDSIPDAKCSYAEELRGKKLKVVFAADMPKNLPERLKKELSEILSGDPRPHYQADPAREYFFEYAGYRVRFCVDGDVATVLGCD